jgi:hypothetical protein
MKQELIDAVWEQGRAMPEADPALWRQDACGAWIRRDHYQAQDSDFGWRAQNVTAGGADSAATLRPFHWRNRYDVAVGRAHCRVSADRSGVPAEKVARPPRNRSL